MKYFYYIILLCSIMHMCKYNAYSQDSISVNDREVILQLKESLSKKDYNTFWNKFPDNFKQFMIYYGYDNYMHGNLYHESHEHIAYLFDNLIEDREHFRKLISIAIDGHWEADATNYLQEGIKRLLLKYPDVFIAILTKYSDAELESFWNYMLYEPYPLAEDFQYDKYYKDFYDDICKKICSKDERMNIIIKKEYQKILDACN